MLTSRRPLTSERIRSGPAYLEREIELRRNYEFSIGTSRRLLLFLLMITIYLVIGIEAALLFQEYVVGTELYTPEDRLEYLHIIIRIRGADRNLRFFLQQQPFVSFRTEARIFVRNPNFEQPLWVVPNIEEAAPLPHPLRRICTSKKAN